MARRRVAQEAERRHAREPLPVDPVAALLDEALREQVADREAEQARAHLRDERLSSSSSSRARKESERGRARGVVSLFSIL